MTPNRTDCDPLRDLLVPYLDGELRPEERLQVEGHLAQCLACSDELESHRRLQEALLSARSEPEPPDAPEVHELSRRVREQVRRAPVIPGARWLRGGALRFAACALAGVGLLALAAALFKPSDGVGRPVAISLAPPDELLGSLDVLEALEAEGLEPTPELAQLLQDLAAQDMLDDGGMDGPALDGASLDDALDIPWEELGEESL